MNIIVCIKQVPDTAKGVRFKPDGTLDRSAMASILNPDDRSALEAALRIKDTDPQNVHVTAITMGLPKAEAVLREAYAMGVDDGILLTDRQLGGADTWATSSTLAGAIRKLPYDLILTGRQAIDGDTAQVGPELAEHLHLPIISYASDIEVTGTTLTARRHYENGYQRLEVQLPCLVTVLGEEIEPRYKTPGGIFTAFDKTVQVWGRADLDVDDSDIGKKGSPTLIAKAADRKAKGKGVQVTPETSDEAAGMIFQQLAEKHIL